MHVHGPSKSAVSRRGDSGSSTPFDLVRLLLGLLLAAAALLKLQTVADHSSQDGQLAAIGEWALIAVEIFGALCLFLCARRHRPTVRIGAMCLFTAFAAVSLTKALTGASTCGCFGSMAVSPWSALSLDIAAIAALGLSEIRERPMRRQFLLLRIGRAVSVCLLLVLSTAFVIQGAMASATHFGLSGGGARSDLVVLDPDDWVGRRFPLLSHIDVGETLASGEWTVVLYHSECPRCRAELRAIHEQAFAADPAVRRIALVELPPHGASLPGDHGGRVPIVYARYAAETDWFGELPITVQLSDGVVLSAGH